MGIKNLYAISDEALKDLPLETYAKIEIARQLKRIADVLDAIREQGIVTFAEGV